MTVNRGKAFELRFKEDFLESIPNSIIDRLYDSMSGYKAVSNISDFIAYKYPIIFYIEVKSHGGASIPFTAISQYEKLKTKIGIHGVRAGVVLWLTEKDRIFYIPVSTIKQLKAEGKKSVGIKAFDDGYNIYEIPVVKKRVFLKADYSILMTLKDGE